MPLLILTACKDCKYHCFAITQSVFSTDGASVGSGGGSAGFLERGWQLREPHRTERGEPLAQGNCQLPNPGEPHRAKLLHRKEIHETECERVRLGYYQLGLVAKEELMALTWQPSLTSSRPKIQHWPS